MERALQYINPIVKNSQHPLKGDFLYAIERVLKLSIPTLYLWLCMFYCLFHLWWVSVTLFVGFVFAFHKSIVCQNIKVGSFICHIEVVCNFVIDEFYALVTEFICTYLGAFYILLKVLFYWIHCCIFAIQGFEWLVL